MHVVTARDLAKLPQILWQTLHKSMACNLSQYCAGNNYCRSKNVYPDIRRGNIFIGTIVAAKQFGSLNTGTIAAAKSKMLWMGKYHHSRMFTEPFAAAKTFTGTVAATKNIYQARSNHHVMHVHLICLVVYIYKFLFIIFIHWQVLMLWMLWSRYWLPFREY